MYCEILKSYIFQNYTHKLYNFEIAQKKFRNCTEKRKISKFPCNFKIVSRNFVKI